MTNDEPKATQAPRVAGERPRDLAVILERVERIAGSSVRNDAERVDREAVWPEAGLRALQAEGLGGLVVPSALGGLGQGLFGLTRVCERLGQECASTALCYGMHCVGAAVIAAKATEPQQRRYLMPIAEGRHLTTLSLSEPGTGAHFYLPQTRLIRGGPDRFRVDGQKTFVTSGGHADSYVISAVDSASDAPPGHFSCAVVPASADGISWGPAWDGMGMRGNSSRAMALHQVEISAEDLLGEEGDQIWYVFNVIAPYFLIAMAGTYLGIAAAGVADARNHLATRQHGHSGRRLAEVGILQHRLGGLWSVLERTRALIHDAARRYDEGDPAAALGIMVAKVEAAEASVSVVNEVLTLMGGIGYRAGGRLHRLLRDARAGHVMSPTTDLLRLWIGRELLGQPLIAD